MKVKLDLEVKCPHCGETQLIDWQITRNCEKDKLLVDTLCICKEFGRQEIEYKNE